MSDNGAAYWGKHGAAGLLLRAPGPTARLRSCCNTGRRGVTKAAPGDCPAAPATATRRPSRPPFAKPTRKPGCPPIAERAHHRSHRRGDGRWTYTTVIADAEELLDTVPNRESAELRWVAEDEVADLPLHPGFAASWERLREVAATIPLVVKPSLELVAQPPADRRRL